ncbi:MAG: GFA family protein [Gammaproteobacteria bacterium]
MANTYKGGCGCVATRYEFACEPLSCYACHCTDCQSRSGAAFTLTVIIPLTEITLTMRDAATFKRNAIDFRNCSECGGRLWAVWHPVPDFALLAAGTLDDTSWIRPVAHVWTSSAQPWIGLNKDATLFERQPEDPTVLLELWNQREEAKAGRQ